MKLNNNELMNISGGINYSVIAGIGAAFAFIVSIIDGFLNPIKCN